MKPTYPLKTEPGVFLYCEENVNNGKHKWWIYSEDLGIDEEAITLGRLFGFSRGATRARLERMADGFIEPDDLFKNKAKPRRSRRSPKATEKERIHDRERSLSPRTVPPGGWIVDTGWPVPEHVKEMKR